MVIICSKIKGVKKVEGMRTIITILKVVGFVLPLLLSIGGIHFFFYSRSPKYYFKVAKMFSKWRDTNWKISAVFTINRQVEFFKMFEGILQEQYGRGNYRRTFNLKNKKLYEFGNFTLTIQSDLDVSQGDNISVELLFSNVNVTYRNAERMLKELRILFHNVEKNMTILDKNYNLNVKFNSMRNPFYGLMIQRLGEEHVEYFECVFPLSLLLKKDIGERSSENYTLRVFKEYVTINETDFNTVEDIAKKCLLMG